MKTPEEIKKALKCESISREFCEYQMACLDCEFYVSEYMSEQIAADALNYIQQLENHIGELTEKVAQLEAAQPKWISVEIELPPTGERVIACVMKAACFEAYTDCENNWYRVVTGQNIEKYLGRITHWMPLPNPPRMNHERA